MPARGARALKAPLPFTERGLRKAPTGITG
jgi:hypothetical protein